MAEITIGTMTTMATIMAITTKVNHLDKQAIKMAIITITGPGILCATTVAGAVTFRETVQRTTTITITMELPMLKTAPRPMNQMEMRITITIMMQIRMHSVMYNME